MTPMHEPPSRRETERHFSSYDRCHSYARAEKDLIVKMALRAWQSFRHPDATLALEGGTCLGVYHGLVHRFSEDIDMRVILADELERGPADRRIAAFRDVSRAFAEHVHNTLPFLRPLPRKGRFRRRDGRFQSHIFAYEGWIPHQRVVEGLKLELVQQPNRLPLSHVPALGGGTVLVISPAETCMGKWHAVCDRLPGRARIYPALVRHPWDLGTLSATLSAIAARPAPALAKMIRELRGPKVSAALRELRDPAWGEAFADYAGAMATRPVVDFTHSDDTPPVDRAEKRRRAGRAQHGSRPRPRPPRSAEDGRGAVMPPRYARLRPWRFRFQRGGIGSPSRTECLHVTLHVEPAAVPVGATPVFLQRVPAKLDDCPQFAPGQNPQVVAEIPETPAVRFF